MEMAFSNLEQNKPEQALLWVEKAMKESTNPEDLEWYNEVFLTTDGWNKEACQALLNKYFPQAEKK